MERVNFKMWAEQDPLRTVIMIKIGDEEPRVWMEWARIRPEEFHPDTQPQTNTAEDI